MSTADADDRRPSKASPKVAEAPPTPKPSVSLAPASESADPAVHRLLFERQTAAEAGDDDELSRIADALAELGCR